ncbi:hypothetical protein EJP82_25080 [Paenibacillus anaericanus]|uniref:Dual OB-containing domain-containing protein n=1 Tax=Paenibacillus anaericanus TaxID=170367 RepID=A0A3S1DKT5_9BACL|nr:hypothetical protein [Paenibacillus anaericanus]RUT40360.1 hypothetical protein EJP82_25080 [Paenibacillus anaericanus]
MRFTLLAVTKSFGGFCIAGMNEDGDWIRPISQASNGRFWTRAELSIGGRFAQSGDVWDIQGSPPHRFEYPNHTEDFLLTGWRFVESLGHTAFLRFLAERCEGETDLEDVFQANGRSLCLISVDSFEDYTTNIDNKHRARMIFSSDELDVENPHTNNGNIVVKDCKWEGYLLRGERVPTVYRQIYVCIGLATANNFNGIEYPQVVGLHTNPHLEILIHYPD